MCSQGDKPAKRDFPPPQYDDNFILDEQENATEPDPDTDFDYGDVPCPPDLAELLLDIRDLLAELVQFFRPKLEAFNQEPKGC